jgi:hypothetical protein
MCLAVATMGQDPQIAARETNLSEIEVVEAGLLAENFALRFEESADITPLIKEFYAPGFANRLRSAPLATGLTFVSASEAVVREASDDDLIRLYAANINLLYLSSRHYGAAIWERKQAGEDSDEAEGEVSLELEKLMPAEAVKLLKSEEVFRELFFGDNDVERVRPTQASDDEQEIEAEKFQNGDEGPRRELVAKEVDESDIKTIARLRSFTVLVERVNAILRQNARTLPSLNSLREGMQHGAKEVQQSAGPTPTVLQQDWMGYSSGQRLICVEVLIFHTDLVLVEGRLQIAAMYFAPRC